MYDKIPKVRYISPTGYQDMADITVSFNVKQKVIEEGALPVQMTVSEMDRPDVFSDRAYGDSTMHWVTMRINEKINPYYDWVLSPQAFDNYVGEKYPGYTLFLTDISGLHAFEGSFRGNDIVFATGVTNADLQPDIQSSLKNARVVSYDPVYCRLVMEFTQKTAWIPAEGDYIAGANTDKLGVSTYYVARIGKVIESPYAVHHFENSDNELLDPMIPESLHNKFIAEEDLGYTFGDTPLGKYILQDFGDYTITNREYEVGINDENRNISVVAKKYLTNIGRDVATALNNV
jgi:hypothetical protein